MKLFQNNQEYGEVVSFTKTGRKKEVKQQGQLKPLETFYEYKLVSTKKVLPAMINYQIEDGDKKFALQIANEKPQKTKEGFLIHVFTSDA